MSHSLLGWASRALCGLLVSSLVLAPAHTSAAAADLVVAAGDVSHTLVDHAVFAALPANMAQGAMKGVLGPYEAEPGSVWYVVRGMSTNKGPKERILGFGGFWVTVGETKFTPKAASAFQPEDTSIMRSVRIAPGANQPWVVFFQIPKGTTGVMLNLTNFAMGRAKVVTQVPLADAVPTAKPQPFKGGPAEPAPMAMASTPSAPTPLPAPAPASVAPPAQPSPSVAATAPAPPSAPAASAPATTSAPPRQPSASGLIRVYIAGVTNGGFVAAEVADSVGDLVKLFRTKKKTLEVVETANEADIEVIVTGREVAGTGQREYTTRSGNSWGGGNRTTTSSKEKTTNQIHVLLQVGAFRQEMSGTGPFWAVAANEVVNQVEKWVRQNSAQIRATAR